MAYNADVAPFTVGEVWNVVWHGLSMDMSTAGYLIVLPWLVGLVGYVWPGRWERWTLRIYVWIAAIFVGYFTCLDAVLYPFWKFKLNASVFAYMTDMQGTTNSVSLGFLLSRMALGAAVITLLGTAQCRALRLLRPQEQTTRRRARTRKATSLIPLISYLLLPLPLFLVIRGGIGTGSQNVGTAYYSQTLFYNHAAVNPIFSLISSIKRTEDFAHQFRFYEADECRRILAEAYAPTPTPGEALLRTERPNLLIVMMEGFGGKFVETLGGLPDVAPRFNRLVPQGIFFDNYWSNSFRTDRGSVSLLSGWVSYPTTSLMRLPDRMAAAPGLARSLATAGYSTTYLYGGDITFAGTNGYLVANGYQRIVSDRDFPVAEARSGKWGVPDHLTAQRAAALVSELDRAADGKPWMLTYQTLSSHEPFEVPYESGLKDPILNAFAYTDHAVGTLIDALRETDAWDNLLVILVPDHGFLYDLTYEHPDYFHCPMLWLGGAVREPRRIGVLMNQSDVCATLLGQMRLPHDDYPWSRDVLSPDYTEAFAYSTSPSTAMYADSTGTTLFDTESLTVVAEQPSPSDSRQHRVKALLQHTYTRLDAMGR